MQSEEFLNQSSVDPRNLIETVAATALESARTATINLDKNFSHVLVTIETSRNAHTAVEVTAKKSTDGGTNYSSITSASVFAGAATVSDYVETYSASTDASFTREYDVRGADKMTVLVALTAGNANDSVTIRASGTRV